MYNNRVRVVDMSAIDWLMRGMEVLSVLITVYIVFWIFTDGMEEHAIRKFS
ncbi:hypothetical protein BS78_10G064500 [Paspalum vaginatum]|nr:hypothetical protein BS78_10G064500 [Paspalum vaginatum]